MEGSTLHKIFVQVWDALEDPKSIIDELSKKDGRFLIIASARIYYDPFFHHIYIPNIVIK